MKSWIHLSRGKVLRQAHAALDELGGLVEDELGRKGFMGRVAELYRRNPPTQWTRQTGDYRSWDIDGFALKPTDLDDPYGAPLKVMHNEDISVWISRRSAAMPFAFRNVDGDELYFIHAGT